MRKLREQTGLITLDPGFANTGSCLSKITFMDGEKGILRYRGIPVEELAQHSTFKETAYLLVNGVLPTKGELNRWGELLNDASLVHEDMREFFQNFPRASHPMGILSSMVNALRSFYPYLEDKGRGDRPHRDPAVVQNPHPGGHVLQDLQGPHGGLSPAGFELLPEFFEHDVRLARKAPPAQPEKVVRALSIFWVLHADHEQNCSTSTVRIVGSGKVNLYAAISAGIARPCGGPCTAGPTRR